MHQTHSTKTWRKYLHEQTNGWCYLIKKTDSILLPCKVTKPVHASLIMNNETITNVESHKHLGITFESSGSWHKHIQLITSKAMQRIHINLVRKSLDIIYTSFIWPISEYADVVWCNLTKYQEDKLEKYKLKLERSGSVVECLTRDRRAAGSSLTGVTALWSLSKTHLS